MVFLENRQISFIKHLSFWTDQIERLALCRQKKPQKIGSAACEGIVRIMKFRLDFFGKKSYLAESACKMRTN